MSSQDQVCKYKNEYNDALEWRYKEYRCDRKCVADSDYCGFHDENYFMAHEEEMKKKFNNELENKILEASHIINFVGCNLSTISISEIKHSEKSISFVGAKFHDDVKFHNSEFKGLDFSNAVFYKQMINNKLIIKDIFDFHNVTFKKESKGITFLNCHLDENNFSFINVKSLKFTDCVIKNTNFRKANISKLDVKDCVFADKTDFGGCNFSESVEFITTSFASNTNLQYTIFQKTAKFHYIDFKEPQLVIFGKNLSQVSFMHTDITRVRFEDSTLWEENHGYKIFDARELAKNPEDYNLSSVLAIYRNLRENYEFHLMYEEAGKFFIEEMNLKRKYSENSNNKTTKKKFWRYVSFSNFYNILADYGENLSKILVWTSIVVFISILYFFLELGIIIPDETIALCDNNSKSIEHYKNIELAVGKFFGPFFRTNDAKLLDYVIHIISIPILAVLFITLRRKFERRFRH